MHADVRRFQISALPAMWNHNQPLRPVFYWCLLFWLVLLQVDRDQQQRIFGGLRNEIEATAAAALARSR